jgi:hypothetical protein
MARNRHLAGFGWMLVLAVTSILRNLPPTVRFHHFDNVSELHPSFSINRLTSRTFMVSPAGQKFW